MVVNFYKILRRMVEGKAHISLPLAYRKAFYCVNYFVGNPEGKLWSSGSGNILLFLGGCSWHRETLKGKNKWSACVFSVAMLTGSRTSAPCTALICLLLKEASDLIRNDNKSCCTLWSTRTVADE